MRHSELEKVRSLARGVRLPDEVRERVLQEARAEERARVGEICEDGHVQAQVWMHVDHEGERVEMADAKPYRQSASSPKMANGSVDEGGVRLHHRDAFGSMGDGIPANEAESQLHRRGVSGSGRRSRARRVPRGAVLAATLCGAALVGTVAYATSDGNLLASLFGAQAREDVAGYELTYGFGDDSYTAYVPTRIWYDADPAAADELMGDCVMQVDKSVTVDGYTLTMQSIMMDENDLGVASFVITGEDGLPVVEVDDSGEFHFSYDSVLSGIGLVWPEGGWMNMRTVIDESASTSQEVHCVVLFDADPEGIGVEKLSWFLSLRNNEESQKSAIVVDVPQKRVKTVECTSPDSAFTVSVSPFGYVIDAREMEGTIGGFSAKRIAFQFDDGEERVGEDYGERIYNQYFGSDPQDNLSVRSMPTFFIDTSRLESVTADIMYDHRDGEQFETGNLMYRPQGQGDEP